MQLNSLQDVFVEQIGDLYSAEQQLVNALPKVASAATDDKLRTALNEHLEETRGHVRRLENIFEQLGVATPNEQCKGMQGLVEEGEQIVQTQGDPAAKDAALIAAAQRVEHYEIAGYGTARTLADELGFDDAKDLLNDTLDEESDADEKLTKIATGGHRQAGVNRAASG
jgi:ferritin-like metal-binding protein YciE